MTARAAINGCLESALRGRSDSGKRSVYESHRLPTVRRPSKIAIGTPISATHLVENVEKSVKIQSLTETYVMPI
jgi:hypothetical protein